MNVISRGVIIVEIKENAGCFPLFAEREKNFDNKTIKYAAEESQNAIWTLLATFSVKASIVINFIECISAFVCFAQYDVQKVASKGLTQRSLEMLFLRLGFDFLMNRSRFPS